MNKKYRDKLRRVHPDSKFRVNIIFTKHETTNEHDVSITIFELTKNDI